MSKQIYVDCNRINCDDKNNDETNIWTYKLRNELRLPAGTQISLSNSFINQKGINGSSIEIEEDIEEKITYFIYLNDLFHAIPDKTGADRDGQLFRDCMRRFNYDSLTTGLQNTTKNLLQSGNTYGGSNIPLILYEPFTTLGGQVKIRPVVNDKIIKIKKGVYGINQLNDIINNQINNKLNRDQQPTGILDTPILNSSFRGNLAEGGSGFTKIVTPYNAKALADEANPRESAFIQELTAGHVLIPIHAHRANLNDNLNNTEYPQMDWDSYRTADGTYSTSSMFAVLEDNQTEAPAGDADILNYNLGFKKYCLGTTEFNMDYNSENSSFSMNNLHFSYRIPTLDLRSNENLNPGETAICLRSPATNDLTDESNATQEALRSTLRTPVTRLGGVIIHNFSFDRSEKESSLGVTVPRNVNYSFNDLINNDKKARQIWKQTLWHRLGFSYEQLNETSHFERFKIYNLPFNNEIDHLGGITTRGDLDISIYSQTSCKQNPFVLQHQLTNEDVGGFSGFNFIPSNTPRNPYTLPYARNNATVSYNGSMFSRSTVINILSGGRPLLAENLPSLSIHGYYLISSDIIPQYNDIVGDSTPLSLIGVVPKSSLSNQDFIETNNDIINVLNNPIVINKIQIQVLNPDMTAPSLSDNSSCILKFEIPDEEQPKENK